MFVLEFSQMMSKPGDIMIFVIFSPEKGSFVLAPCVSPLLALVYIFVITRSMKFYRI